MNISPRLQSEIDKKIAEIDALAPDLPAVIIIHRFSDFSVQYMSPNGLEALGISMEELQALGNEYQHRFFNPDDIQHIIPTIHDLLTNNDLRKMVSFFHEMKFAGKDEWLWHISSMKILMHDDEGQPLLSISIALPVESMKSLTAKAEKLQQENIFLRENYQRFALLGNREKDVLKLVSLGKSTIEISETLFISTATVETHRKNIRKKLEAGSHYELAQYARAFDLI